MERSMQRRFSDTLINRVLNHNNTSKGDGNKRTNYTLGKTTVVTIPCNLNGKIGVEIITVFFKGNRREKEYPTWGTASLLVRTRPHWDFETNNVKNPKRTAYLLKNGSRQHHTHDIRQDGYILRPHDVHKELKSPSKPKTDRDRKKQDKVKQRDHKARIALERQ